MPRTLRHAISIQDWVLGFAASIALAVVCYWIFGDYIASTAIAIGGAPVWTEQWAIERYRAAQKRAQETPPPLPYPWGEADR